MPKMTDLADIICTDIYPPYEASDNQNVADICISDNPTT